MTLGGPKPRALLAALLLAGGRVVASERLVDVLWGDDPPRSAAALVQTYVYGLRRTLTDAGEPELIETRSPGYAIRCPPGRLDVEAFYRAVAEGRRHAAAGEHGQVVESLRAALALWRGSALGGVGDVLRGEAARLDETRLLVVEELLEAELALGRSAEAAGELTELVRAHPARERPRAMLMRALYRLGRQSDALAVYHEGRQALADDLGVDPGHELRELYEALLRGDPALGQDTPVRAAARVVPAHLPRGVADFTGRQEQLDELATLLGAPSDTVTVCVISGKGGVGKSTLAVKAAHLVAPAYPDGQLYADLRGVTGSPAPALEVLGRFLRALGLPCSEVPATAPECVDAYRSALHGRRVLVVLDDAANEQQIRPLLPGSPTCAVLITTRRRLAGLEGVSVTDLDVLDPPAALELLARMAGADRVQAEKESARRIVHLCGHLPLALRTAGARLAARPHWPLAALAGRLADECRRLDELTAGDLEVRASVALSYQGLDEQAKRAFRWLGLLGVPDFASWVPAALLGVPETEADKVIDHLMDAQLLDHVAVDAAGQARYRLHDLLRVYAAERAEAEDPPGERAAAVNRALGGWLWLITRAAAARPPGALTPRREYSMARPVESEVPDLLAWFNAESPALVVVVERAAAMNLYKVACEVAAALCSSSFSVDTRFEEWRRTHESALEAARRAGDPLAEATLLVGLGQLRCRQDRYPEAQAFFHQALPLLRAGGDTHGEAVAVAGIGTACRELGDLAVALAHLREAAATFTRLGDGAAVGHVKRLAGSVLLEQGEFGPARELLDDALAAFRRLGSKRGEGITLRTIGLVHRAAGELGRAEEVSEQAVVLLREAGDPLMLAYCVQALAKVRIRLGGDTEVLPCLREALEECERHQDRFGMALIERTVGELHLARGRYARAEEHLRRSVAMWEALGLPLFRARTMRDLATVREAVGDGPAASAMREAALAVFAHCGTREYGELS
ncbi:AfsR/SARP family transcriptional regulator [Nonomuraea sp. PA05]|uniref:AfsR/SARP family transcriptional regulator n=1 Tax=Nonomuraea sp. PA05 TaxID=2604466 RepID=UPI0021CC610F|nr:BTAD domain-containing putative transcriptional regulator [Nonomuraea sp. PA05]